MWALERGLDISISAVAKLAFLYKKVVHFFKTMQEYMIKFNRLLTSKNVDSINIEKALL
ncbi:hypothetical protein RRG53_01345 [Mycoplasmopsis cynos]|uniref:Uncharacterized protein n=1 Tax=Mycoplasmopsis cynos (strain C142) TaxID=1246955 RepID=L0RUA8_MYCC1|nr:hypothetical protein [Mycoplasmopsis cynos]WQQ18701.1 hypothetical protein RRG53_01345 [Mycoplasmopsis cynos]CCP23829.1 Hypothetical protein MCYN_0097 [Mycoplasmopsis cynos C142]